MSWGSADAPPQSPQLWRWLRAGWLTCPCLWLTDCGRAPKTRLALGVTPGDHPRRPPPRSSGGGVLSSWARAEGGPRLGWPDLPSHTGLGQQEAAWGQRPSVPGLRACAQTPAAPSCRPECREGPWRGCQPTYRAGRPRAQHFPSRGPKWKAGGTLVLPFSGHPPAPQLSGCVCLGVSVALLFPTPSLLSPLGLVVPVSLVSPSSLL